MTPDQEALFSSSEGDAWFRRNQNHLSQIDAEDDLPLQLIGLYHLDPASVLEVGGANGIRLSKLRKEGRTLVCIDPSRSALLDGRGRWPSIAHVRAVGANLPVNRPFDLVIVNFVLHWVDRENLEATIAEIDAAVSGGGHLIIGDFLPREPVKVPYHHLPKEGVFTHKQDYRQPFLELGHYTEVATFTGCHGDRKLGTHVPDDDRIAVSLLEKAPTPNNRGTGGGNTGDGRAR